MIILLTGDNVYEINKKLAQLVAGHASEPEYFHVDMMQPGDVGDIFQGMSLFSLNRMVVLKRASENTDVWEKIAELSDKESDTTVILVEPKVDKRTKSYKTIAKNADVQQFKAWTERDTREAESWLKKAAATRKITLDASAAHEIVRRRGTDQYQLLSTLDQLSLLGNITLEMVQSHIEPPLEEDVFSLLDVALTGTADQLRQKLRTLQLTNDPYMTMGLLASQMFALAALVYGSDKSQADMTAELGVSAFVLRNLSSAARTLNTSRMAYVVQQLSDADYGIKSKLADPWVQIEVALMNIVTHRA